MLSMTEVERLAAMANALRPDWPTRSLQTHIAANHMQRAYRDLACALAYVATDPQTKTPARLIEAGPWWQVTPEPSRVQAGRPIPCPDHPGRKASNCPDCRAEAVPPPPNWRKP